MEVGGAKALMFFPSLSGSFVRMGFSVGGGIGRLGGLLSLRGFSYFSCSLFL